MNEWLNIYRLYSDDEIADELAFLKEESRNIYVAQGQGSKTNQRDLTGVKQRLNAITMVINERAGNPSIRDSVADFGGERRASVNIPDWPI